MISRVAEGLGRTAVARLRAVATVAGTAAAITWAAIRPGSWRRTVRGALVLQVLRSGVQALGIVCVLGAALGVLIVVQYQVWVGRYIQTQLLSAAMVVVVVRELGPLLVNFVIIARSGSAVAQELGLMHAAGETRVLQGLGLDPLAYLVLPRVAGLVISTACLTLVLIAACFAAVYAIGPWVGVKTGPALEFVQGCLANVTPADVSNLLVKCTVPPLITGTVCCLEGLSAGDTIADASRAATRAVTRSIILLFAVSAVVSVATYVG